MRMEVLARLEQSKAEKDRARGFGQDVEYYVLDALCRLHAHYEDRLERSLVLAIKHCPREHHDWEEIKSMLAAGEGKPEKKAPRGKRGN